MIITTLKTKTMIIGGMTMTEPSYEQSEALEGKPIKSLNEPETLDYKPTIAELEKAIGTPYEMDILPNGEVRPKHPTIECVSNPCNCPEQPNPELMMIKTIQGLAHVITNNLEKLPDEPLRRMALDDIGIFEAGVLYKLQEEYE